MFSLKRNTPNILGTGFYFISNVLLNSHYASSLRRVWKLFCDRYIQLHVLQEKAQFHSWLPPGYYKWTSRLYLGNSLVLILVMCRTNVKLNPHMNSFLKSVRTQKEKKKKRRRKDLSKKKFLILKKDFFSCLILNSYRIGCFFMAEVWEDNAAHEASHRWDSWK